MRKHFTASMYLLSKVDGEIKVLLHLHDKLKIWLGVGGHIEKNENPLEAALREAKEESGVDVILISDETLIKTNEVEQIPRPVYILEEKIPPFKGAHAHIHIDLIYFGYVENPKKIKMKEKYQWCSKSDLKKMKLQYEISRFAPMAIKAGEKYVKVISY